MSEDFNVLIKYAKSFTGLTPEHEQCLKDIAPVIIPHLEDVTNAFYEQLAEIPATTKFLEGRTNKLKNLHLNWLIGLFESDVDAKFAEKMYDVGYVHVEIQLPISFVAGTMTLINNELAKIIITEFGDDKETSIKAVQSINSVTGLSLMMMQQAFQLWD